MDADCSLLSTEGVDYEEEEDVINYLPALKKENDGALGVPRNTPVKLETLEDVEGWYATFVNEAKDDVEPQKLHELVLDYLICGGYQEAAELLCADAEMKFPSGTAVPPGTESLERRNKIRNHIVNGEMEVAMQDIETLAPTLLNDDPRIHFKLLRQRLVELIRAKELDKVLDFANHHLVDKCQQPPGLFTKLEQTYALLAFDSPENSPFGYLMSLSQRNMLANEVNSAILASLNKSSVSKLEQLLRFMVWNQNQYLTKGDGGRAPSHETTSQIAKELFGSDEDPTSDML